ncbi:MAG: isoquinoline 1-oxidoreductase alpha subunit [Patiriisocius sp.]|jgi:isoquinoline 1-oxidoreductase alpha subunit
MPIYNLTINGKNQTIENDDDIPLLWVLRDQLDMLGTKYGCGIGECGACTIHVDGLAQRSCSYPLSLADGKSITTIEGLSENGDHPVQQAWREIDVPQCGYCQSGQIMNASAFLDANPNPSKSEIKAAMNGNICRCATYNNIEKAIETAASKNS